MTDDYCKLVSGIILSTIWREDDHTRILWITMLALKNRNHCVMASIPGLAAVANIPIESCIAGLSKLAKPDPHSRTKEHEGRRIMEVDGGWMVLNGEKYRNFMSKQERNEYQARLMSEIRSKSKMLAPVSRKLALLAQAEAEAEADKEEEGKGADAPPTETSKKRKFIEPTEAELTEFCASIELPVSDALWFFWKGKGNGWTNGGKPIKDWKSTIRSWKIAGYFPSQKSGVNTTARRPLTDAEILKAAR